MNCKKIQTLQIAHLLGDSFPQSNRARRIKNHLSACTRCAREYRELQKSLEFLQRHKTDFSKALIHRRDVKPQQYRTAEQSWNAIKDKIERLHPAPKTKKTAAYTWLRRIAPAACLAIAASIWLSGRLSQTTPPQNTPAGIAYNKPSLQIELLSDKGNKLISPGTEIRTDKHNPKTLLIENRHRLVMNSATILTIHPLKKYSASGCRIKLKYGEIYARVAHTGNNFQINTRHGTALIKGTVFDIRTTKEHTTLVVTEGNVQLKSQKGSVDVKTGQTSSISRNSAPTVPAYCNVTELTKWVPAENDYTPVAGQKSDSGNYDLNRLWQNSLYQPVKLQEIDYQNWVKEKKEWFKQNFPWIFWLKKALAEQAVQTAYPELLVQSTDIWQFNYPHKARRRIPVFNPRSMEYTAAFYGLSKSWIHKNMSGFSPYPTGRKSQHLPENIPEFKRWLKAVSGKSEPDNTTLTASWYAAVYVIRTRTLIWLSVKKRGYDLTETEQKEILELIQNQVNAACTAESLITKLYRTEPPEQPCSRAEYQQLIKRLAGNIKKIVSIEKQIAEHEISGRNTQKEVMPMNR